MKKKKKLKRTNNKELDDLIKKMLNPNINERISWNNYFQHSFFNLNQNLFNNKCIIHSKDYYAYCSKCKQNICELCSNNHSSKEHNIILFSQIGLSQNEIKEFNNIIEEIEINVKKILDIKNEINEFINNIKLINENSSVYENDKKNNYKYYTIEYLKVINEKIKIEKINLPKIKKVIEKERIENIGKDDILK